MRLKVERRLEVPKWTGVAVPLVSVAIALIIMGIVIFFYMYSKPSYLKQAVFGAFNEYSSNVRKIPEKAWPRVEKLLKAGREKMAPSVVKGKLSSNVSSFSVSRLEEVFRSTEESYKFLLDIGESSKDLPESFKKLKKLHEKIPQISKAYSKVVSTLSAMKSLEGEYDSEELKDAFEGLKGLDFLEGMIEKIENISEDPEDARKVLKEVKNELPKVVGKKMVELMKETEDQMQQKCRCSVWKSIAEEYASYVEGMVKDPFNPAWTGKAEKVVSDLELYYCFTPLVKVWNDSLKVVSDLNKRVSTIEGVYSQLSSALRSAGGVLKSLKKGRTIFVKDTVYSMKRYVSNAIKRIEKDDFLRGIFAERLKSLKALESDVEKLASSLGTPSEIKERSEEVSKEVEELSSRISEEMEGIAKTFKESLAAFVEGAVDSVEKVQLELFPQGGIEGYISKALRWLVQTYIWKLSEIEGLDRVKLSMAYSNLKGISKDFLRFLRDSAESFPFADSKMKLKFEYQVYVFAMDALRKRTSAEISMDSDRAKAEIDEIFSTSIDRETFFSKVSAVLEEHLKRVRKILEGLEDDFDELTTEFGQIGRVGRIAVLKAYEQLSTWPFIPSEGLPDTINYMTPLLFIGLGLILVFQMKLWNIGAEGQYYVGVITALWLSLFVIKDASSAHIPLILLLGGLAGAGWAAIAGVLKAYLNIDEIVSTLMLNYIAFHWMEHLVYGPWKAPTNFPETEEIPKALFLPTFGESRVHIGIIIALSLTIVVYILMRKTWWGFDLRVIGDNQNAARYAGINIAKNIALAMAVSGFFAGLAGATQILGFEHKLYHGYAPGYGYTGIIIAWLSRLNPWATILVSFLFGGFLVGGDQIQLVLKLPKAMVVAIEGVMLFSLIASEVLFKYRIRVVRK